MSVLRDDFNKITPKFKAGSPNITKWLDDATSIIDDLVSRVSSLEQREANTKAAVASLSVAQPYTMDQVADTLRKLLAALA